MSYDLSGILLNISVLIFAIVVHEVAHGYVAYRLGDPTAHRSNRLSLNPLDHVDPMGSIIVPLFLVLTNSSVMLGWAKPVPIDPRYFRHPRRDEVLVSLAGVTANLILAAIAGLFFRALAPAPNSTLDVFLILACRTNVALAVFNLMPIPPLDGSHIVAALLPPRAAESFQRISRAGIILIYLLLFVGALNKVMVPVMRSLERLFLGGGA